MVRLGSLHSTGFMDSFLASWLGRNPNEDLEYQEVQTREQNFLDGPYPTQEEDPIEVGEETEDQVTIIISGGDQRRILRKIPGRDGVHVVQQKIAQTKETELQVLGINRTNAGLTKRSNQGGIDRTCMGLLTGRQPASTDSCKLQNLWQGPLAVTTIR